jgi:hypothetical protein
MLPVVIYNSSHVTIKMVSVKLIVLALSMYDLFDKMNFCL